VVYLHGVHVESIGDGDCLLVATDGHRLGVMRLSPQSDEPFKPDLCFTISTNNKELMKTAKAKINQTRILVIDFTKQQIVIKSKEHGGETMIAIFPHEILGDFPDWRRVFPCGVNGDSSFGYNADYVQSFAYSKSDSLVHISPNGNNSALVTNTDSRFIGAIMPMRGACKDDCARMEKVLVK